MLTQPTLEKLRSLRLTAMADAFSSQLQQPDINDLSFEERFGLLVDHEWTYMSCNLEVSQSRVKL